MTNLYDNETQVVPSLLRKIAGGGASIESVYETTNPKIVAFKALTISGRAQLHRRAEVQTHVSDEVNGQIFGRFGAFSYNIQIPRIIGNKDGIYFVERAPGFPLEVSEMMDDNAYTEHVRDFLLMPTVQKMHVVLGYLRFLRQLQRKRIIFTDHKQDSVFISCEPSSPSHITITIADPGTDEERREPTSIATALVALIQSVFLDSIGRLTSKGEPHLERALLFRNVEKVKHLLPMLIPTDILTQVIKPLQRDAQYSPLKSMEKDIFDLDKAIQVISDFCTYAATDSKSFENINVREIDRIADKVRELI